MNKMNKTTTQVALLSLKFHRDKSALLQHIAQSTVLSPYSSEKFFSSWLSFSYYKSTAKIQKKTGPHIQENKVSSFKQIRCFKIKQHLKNSLVLQIRKGKLLSLLCKRCSMGAHGFGEERPVSTCTAFTICVKYKCGYLCLIDHLA